MKRVCIIMGGVMPVPAVYGGAVETLITNIVKRYSIKDGIELTICSVYDSEAVRVAKKYPEVKFFWTHTRSVKYMFLHALFLEIKITTGKEFRSLQRHYNEIKKLFEKEKFDLLIAEGGDTQAIIEIAKEYKREQLVNHVHIHYIPPKNIVEGYGNVIGVSDFVTKEYLKVCNNTVNEYVLRNGINIELFTKKLSGEKRQKLRKSLGIEENDFVILFVGRIMQIKGILELMQAITELQNVHIKLLILGGANSGKGSLSRYEREVKKLAKKNKDQFIFKGYIDNEEVYQYTSISDVQCIPTLVEEAAPLVLLEAMAAGMPTIITKSGGMVEYATEDTSVIVERKNLIANLKSAISFMEQNPDVREKMAEDSKKQSQKFSEIEYYNNFVDLVKEIEKGK